MLQDFDVPMRMGPLVTNFNHLLFGEDTAEAALDINATGECASELKQLCKPELAAYLKASAEAGNARQLLAVKPLPELTVDQLMTVIRDAYKGVNSSLSAAEKAQAVMSSKPLAHLRNMPMARCLRQSMNAAKQSIDPNAAEVAPRCKQEVRTLLASRAGDVRRDLPLLSACAGDLHALCGATPTGQGRVVSCLKSNKAKLAARCASLVSDRQREAAEDVSLDVPLANACKTDVATICVNVGWGDGAKLACLQEHQKDVTDACRKQLFRNEVESAEDVTFNAKTSGACAADKVKFCAAVAKGGGRVMACLIENQDKPGFSPLCAMMMKRNAARRSTDWRLNFRLRKLCVAPAQALCPSLL
jgi:hypothetical protein